MVRRLWPYLALAALLGLTYLPLMQGRVLYQRDVGRQVFPEQSFLHQSFQSGDSLLWNPRIGLGISTLANPLNQLFYPPSAPLLLAHSPRATSVYLFFHLVLGGLGMMVLLCRLAKVPVSAALVAGLAWCLSGHTTSEVVAGVRLVSGAYLPWCAVGVLHLVRLARMEIPMRRRLAGVAWAALPLGLCFTTGEVFFPILAGIFAVCVAVGDALQNPEPAQSRRWLARGAVGLCLAATLAVLLGSVVLLPAQQAAQGTARTSAFPRQVAEVGSFHPWRMAEMVAQGAMGDPYADYPAGQWVGEPDLGDRPLLYGAYLGCGVLALALLAFGRRRRLAAVLGLTAGFFLLVSFGRHLPVHALFREIAWPLAFMRGPEKYLALVTAAVSLLAGLGCARLLEAEPRLWPRTLVVPSTLALLLLAAGLFPGAMVDGVRGAAVASLPFALAAFALAYLARRKSRWAGPLLVCLVVVDLARAILALQSFGSPALLGSVPPAARAILADAQARGRLELPRVYRPPAVDSAIARAAPPTSVAEVQRNLASTLIDNHAGSFGIGCVPGYDAATPSTFASLWQVGLGPGPELLRLTGTEYVILPRALPSSPSLQPLLDPAPGVRLFRVEGVLPRVYAARAQSILPDSVAKDVVFAPDVVAGRQVVLAPDPAVPSRATVGQPSSASPGRCRLTFYSNARLEADCDLDSAALAVFLEQFDLGWSATVDGEPAPVLRANLAMRAIPVAAGRHHVVLAFAPPGLRAGLVLSLGGLVVVIVLLVVGCLRRRRPSGVPAQVTARQTATC